MTQESSRARYVRALYDGSLADVGDKNPYSGQSLVLAQLWMRGYRRMLRVRIETGPAMQKYRAGQSSRDEDANGDWLY